jgi:GNAT superfamily N-acetyltransferase
MRIKMGIIIRNLNLKTDIQGIREVHGSDEHWGSDEACFISGKTSLENGFFIQVAICEDKIVGHAEWVISDEPCNRFLYLGMMQIHDAYQKRGIGTKLIESGVNYAKDSCCAFLRTMPEIESGSLHFYQKNGFIQTSDSNTTLKLKTTTIQLNNATQLDKIPFDVIKSTPFVIGLYQHASAHIWKVFNAQHEYDNRTVTSFKINESYINIGAINALEPIEGASVICWSKKITPALISEILSIGGSLGYEYLNFCILNENTSYFNSFNYETSEEHDVFMERHL